MTNHGRYPFSALPDRPDFDWPEGRRLAVYIGMNSNASRSATASARSSRRAGRSPTC